MDKEKQILEYMKKLEISREEAEQLWEDDQEDFIGEEGEEMTKKAKEIKRYEKSKETKKKEPRERKVDNEKLALLTMFAEVLANADIDATIEKETKVHFNYCGNAYSLMLTKHRPPKKS